MDRIYATRSHDMPADPYTRGYVADTGAASDVVFEPSLPPPADALLTVSPLNSSSEEELQMPNLGSPADPTFDADSDDDTMAGLPELIGVDAAEVQNQPSMVHVAERLRVVYRGSVAQSSYEPPLPNSYLWSSMHGSIAENVMSPVSTALSSTDAELFALAHSMGATPVLGIIETIPESDPDNSDNEFEVDATEADEHLRSHCETDEYLHLTRMQQTATSSDVATQTEFVPVLVPLRLLRGPPATAATNPEVYEFFDGEEID